MKNTILKLNSNKGEKEEVEENFHFYLENRNKRQRIWNKTLKLETT